MRVSTMWNPQTRVPFNVTVAANKASNLLVAIPDIGLWQYLVTVWAAKGSIAVLFDSN